MASTRPGAPRPKIVEVGRKCLGRSPQQLERLAIDDEEAFLLGPHDLLFAPSASAQRRMIPERERVVTGIPVNDIVGMDVRAQNGDLVGRVDDVTLTRAGRVKDVIVGLEGTDHAVAVPMGDVRFTNHDYVMYRGTKADLDSMPPVTAYYGPRMAPRGYTENDSAFFRPESHWYRYQFNNEPRGYYSEDYQNYEYYPEGGYEHQTPGYYDTRLPRTPRSDFKRWLP